MNTELTGVSLKAGTSKELISYGDALEAYIKNSNWWTVYSAFDLSDFNPSPLWIAKKTNLAVEEVVKALEGLVVLGHLRKENGAFYPVKSKNFINIDINRKSKAEILEDHSVISGQILNHLEPHAQTAVDNRCFASNTEILTELYKDITSAFEKAFKNSQESKNNDRIYKIAFTAVDVVSNQNTNGMEN